MSEDRIARVTAISARRLEELQNEARYHRERYDLYKAKIHGPRPTSLGRLQELERRHRDADARLASARSEGALERSD